MNASRVVVDRAQLRPNNERQSNPGNDYYAPDYYGDYPKDAAASHEPFQILHFASGKIFSLLDRPCSASA
jgi:hypothetical protein